MRIRRLRILGVAMALSASAALVGAGLYLLPTKVATSANRIADFVLLNEAKSWIDGNAAVAGAFRFPDRDDENDQLRLVAIDDPSMNAPNDPRNPGLGQFPWHRAVYGTLLRRLHAAGAKLVTFDIDFVEPSADPADDAAFAAGMRLQPAAAETGHGGGRFGIDDRRQSGRLAHRAAADHHRPRRARPHQRISVA